MSAHTETTETPITLITKTPAQDFYYASGGGIETDLQGFDNYDRAVEFEDSLSLVRPDAVLFAQRHGITETAYRVEVKEIEHPITGKPTWVVVDYLSEDSLYVASRDSRIEALRAALLLMSEEVDRHYCDDEDCNYETACDTVAVWDSLTDEDVQALLGTVDTLYDVARVVEAIALTGYRVDDSYDGYAPRERVARALLDALNSIQFSAQVAQREHLTQFLVQQVGELHSDLITIGLLSVLKDYQTGGRYLDVLARLVLLGGAQKSEDMLRLADNTDEFDVARAYGLQRARTSWRVRLSLMDATEVAEIAKTHKDERVRGWAVDRFLQLLAR